MKPSFSLDLCHNVQTTSSRAQPWAYASQRKGCFHGDACPRDPYALSCPCALCDCASQGNTPPRAFHAHEPCDIYHGASHGRQLHWVTTIECHCVSSSSSCSLQMRQERGAPTRMVPHDVCFSCLTCLLTSLHLPTRAAWEH